MRPGCHHIRTKGSNWWIDPINRRYLRLPLEEKPREAGWSTGALEDGVWHTYDTWTITTADQAGRWNATPDRQFLVINRPGGPVTAPDPEIVVNPEATL